MTAREAAFKVLGGYRRGGALPGVALGGMSKELTPPDAALAMRIVNGVLQNAALIDYYISSFSSIKLKKIEPRVLDILRLSIYQLAFMTKIPHSAAVDEGVKLASVNANPRAAGFVNALLRKAADASGKMSLPQVAADSAAQILSIKYSHPEWLVKEFIASFGEDSAEALLRANNADSLPVTAQVNTLLASAEDVIRELENDGVTARRHEWLDACVEMSATGDMTRLSSFKKGHIYIQDAAARLAVHAASPEPGMFVIDGCAAPGGKSFAAAVMMKNTGKIAAFDLTQDKAGRISDGANRLKLEIVSAEIRDAAAPAADHAGKADIVIADVPCSGFGVIRKKPEIRYKTEQSVSGLPDIQKSLLQSLSAYVKPGGVLLYSTCSLLERENEAVTGWFVGCNDDFRKEEFELPHIGRITSGECTLLPHIHGTDGFYICKMRRDAP